MVCTICQENGDPSTNMFITGCTSYKLDSFSKHEKSKGHEKSAAIAKTKSESTVNSDAYKILKTLNSENFEKLNKILPVHGSKVPTWVQSGVSPCGMPPVQKFAGKANVFLYLQQVMAPLQFSPVHCMLWNLK